MVFHMTWISHHLSPNHTLITCERDSQTCFDKNPSHMETHTKYISCHIVGSLYMPDGLDHLPRKIAAPNLVLLPHFSIH